MLTFGSASKTVFDIAVGTLKKPFKLTRHVWPLTLVHGVGTRDSDAFKRSMSGKALLLPGMGVIDTNKGTFCFF